MNKKPKRYFLGGDNSGHNYIVPVERRKEWNKWCNLDEDDPIAWNTPEYAVRVNGSIELITFTDPKEER